MHKAVVRYMFILYYILKSLVASGLLEFYSSHQKVKCGKYLLNLVLFNRNFILKTEM